MEETYKPEHPLTIDPLIQVSLIAIQSIWSNKINQSSHLNVEEKEKEKNHKNLINFILTIIKRSKSNSITLKICLYYLHQARKPIRERILKFEKNYNINHDHDNVIFYLNHHPFSYLHPALSAQNMFVAALMLANKFLQDRNFSNRTWAKIAGFSVKDLNSNERTFLSLIDYRSHIHLSAFDTWCVRLRKLMEEKKITTKTDFESFSLIHSSSHLTSNCSNQIQLNHQSTPNQNSNYSNSFITPLRPSSSSFNLLTAPPRLNLKQESVHQNSSNSYNLITPTHQIHSSQSQISTAPPHTKYNQSSHRLVSNSTTPTHHIKYSISSQHKPSKNYSSNLTSDHDTQNGIGFYDSPTLIGQSISPISTSISQSKFKVTPISSSKIQNKKLHLEHQKENTQSTIEPIIEKSNLIHSLDSKPLSPTPLKKINSSIREEIKSCSKSEKLILPVLTIEQIHQKQLELIEQEKRLKEEEIRLKEQERRLLEEHIRLKAQKIRLERREQEDDKLRLARLIDTKSKTKVTSHLIHSTPNSNEKFKTCIPSPHQNLNQSIQNNSNLISQRSSFSDQSQITKTSSSSSSSTTTTTTTTTTSDQLNSIKKISSSDQSNSTKTSSSSNQSNLDHKNEQKLLSKGKEIQNLKEESKVNVDTTLDDHSPRSIIQTNDHNQTISSAQLESKHLTYEIDEQNLLKSINHHSHTLELNKFNPDKRKGTCVDDKEGIISDHLSSSSKDQTTRVQDESNQVCVVKNYQEISNPINLESDHMTSGNDQDDPNLSKNQQQQPEKLQQDPNKIHVELDDKKILPEKIEDDNLTKQGVKDKNQKSTMKSSSDHDQLTLKSTCDSPSTSISKNSTRSSLIAKLEEEQSKYRYPIESKIYQEPNLVEKTNFVPKISPLLTRSSKKAMSSFGEIQSSHLKEATYFSNSHDQNDHYKRYYYNHHHQRNYSHSDQHRRRDITPPLQISKLGLNSCALQENNSDYLNHYHHCHASSSSSSSSISMMDKLNYSSGVDSRALESTISSLSHYPSAPMTHPYHQNGPIDYRSSNYPNETQSQYEKQMNSLSVNSHPPSPSHSSYHRYPSYTKPNHPSSSHNLNHDHLSQLHYLNHDSVYNHPRLPSSFSSNQIRNPAFDRHLPFNLIRPDHPKHVC